MSEELDYLYYKVGSNIVAGAEIVVARKAELHNLNVLDAGSNWIITIYDAATAADATPSTYVTRWVSADGNGTFEFEAEFLHGIVLKQTGASTGNAILTYRSM